PARAPQRAPRRREAVEVELLQPRRALQPPPRLDRRQSCRDQEPALRRLREAESLVERLEPVCELELEALVAAEELDAAKPLVRRRLDRVEGVDESRREARER